MKKLRQIWSNGRRNGEVLDRAVDAWKQAEANAPSETRLSEDSRDRILQAAFNESVESRGERMRPLASLFVPAQRLGLAAAVPALTIALALGWAMGPRVGSLGTGVGQASISPSIEVGKQGDQIVFVIANGGTEHQVYKSHDIKNLEGAEPFTTANGSFRDELTSSGDLVFYRID